RASAPQLGGLFPRDSIAWPAVWPARLSRMPRELSSVGMLFQRIGTAGTVDVQTLLDLRLVAEPAQLHCRAESLRTTNRSGSQRRTKRSGRRSTSSEELHRPLLSH